MLEFVSSPWGFGSIFIISITVLILAILGLKGLNLSFSKSGLTVGGKESKRTSPHSTCPHARDIMEVVRRTIEFSEKRQEIKNSVIEDQMKFYEETEEEIIGLMKNIFTKALSKKIETNVFYTQSTEYSNYIITLKAIFVDIKDYIKMCFKTNHYAEKLPEEQLAYIDKKKAILGQKLTENLDIYWRGDLITRSDLYRLNMDKAKELEQFAEDIFNRAFQISREAKYRIEKLEKEYQEYLGCMVNGDLLDETI